MLELVWCFHVLSRASKKSELCFFPLLKVFPPSPKGQCLSSHHPSMVHWMA